MPDLFLFFVQNFQNSSLIKYTVKARIAPAFSYHVCDVIHIDKHVHGDGVNIAARLEPLSQLPNISGLNVIARTSVMKYKHTEMNIEEIGNELDVGTILQGSVRIAAEKARINVQLIDAKTQQHLWSEDYDRELKDIFAIQSDIALRIARALKIQLVAIEKQQIEKMGTGNTEAYRLWFIHLFAGNSRQVTISYFTR